MSGDNLGIKVNVSERIRHRDCQIWKYLRYVWRYVNCHYRGRHDPLNKRYLKCAENSITITNQVYRNARN